MKTEDAPTHAQELLSSPETLVPPVAAQPHFRAPLNGLDLFSGLGGIALALAPYINTVAYCETDPYACGVLLSRMAKHQLQQAPIWDDVTTLQQANLCDQPIDIITGGFPCQDISTAGSRKGMDGEHSGLYREVMRLVGALRPALVFLENVAAIRGDARIVIRDLATLGYDCRWTTFEGAPHLRDRWWILAANADSFGVTEAARTEAMQAAQAAERQAWRRE